MNNTKRKARAKAKIKAKHRNIQQNSLRAVKKPTASVTGIAEADFEFVEMPNNCNKNIPVLIHKNSETAYHNTLERLSRNEKVYLIAGREELAESLRNRVKKKLKDKKTACIATSDDSNPCEFFLTSPFDLVIQFHLV